MAFVCSLPDARLRDAVDALGVPFNAVLTVWPVDGPPPRPDIDLVVLPYLRASAAFEHLIHVDPRLVQHQAIGYDGVASMLPPGVPFANAAGVHETATAELGLTLVLAMQRGIPDYVRQAEGPPRFDWRPGLADHRVLLIGYGGVNRAVEARLRPFEVTVTRVASRARETPDGPVFAVPDLPAILPETDIVVVAVPHTPHTERLIGAAFLAALPDGALVVNIGRGKLADTEAILAEARSGRLRFALDVTDPEPLPAGHALLSLPNVLVSPHIGGASGAMLPRVARLIHRQIELLTRGEPPVNVVLGAAAAIT